MSDELTWFDRRRGARLNGTFWVEVVGASDGPRRRQGNMSITGLFFTSLEDYGEKGTVRRLKLALRLEDLETPKEINVMARIVRKTSILDLDSGAEITGVAFEYLFETHEGRRPVKWMVRAATEAQLLETNDLDVDCHLPATVWGSTSGAASATVTRLGVESFVLWTEALLAPSTSIRLLVRSPCSLEDYPFDAVVEDCSQAQSLEGEPGFIVWARYTSLETTPDVGASLRNALTLLGEAMVPSETCQPVPLPHLKGDLDQINLWSLLSFFELERRSGVLGVEHDQRWAFLYLREGRLVDIEAPDAGRTPRERLSTVLGWTTGRFGMTFKEVGHLDRFDAPSAALLMDLAREHDEKGVGEPMDRADTGELDLPW